MKKRTWFERVCIVWAIILLVLMGGIFFIRQKSVDTNVTAKKTRVGVMLNGVANDYSWNQAHFEGLKKSERQLNLEIIFWECVPETEECLKVLDEMVKENCEIIIGCSYGFGEYMKQVADEHPEIYFFHASGSQTGANFSSYFGRIYQMRYLCGIVAGLQTKSNEIGYVAAYNMSEVNRGINAFTLGVRSVNPDAVVNVIFVDSWLDNGRTRIGTEKLLADIPDIDVLTMHSNSLEVLDIADERGIWSIGYNTDTSDLYPDTFLTAAVWDWEEFYTPNILACLQKKFTGKHYWEGTETGIVRLSPYSDSVNASTREAVAKAYNHLRKGETDVFYGEIIDKDGRIRVASDESMTDEVMLTKFDWFVEGVRVDE